MTPVDALQIWEQLFTSDECREAKDYYDRNYISTSANKRKGKILEQGATDFDQKYCADDEHEKGHYRTDYYVSGYMDMHLKQNLVAFRHCFEDRIPPHLLLIDFGCGPMTSGLALAELLSKQIPDYKTHTAYLGIDASHNMVAKGQYINDEHALFENFKVMQGTRFDSQEIPPSFPKPQIIVLCFSFVLAPNTLQQDTPDQKPTAQTSIKNFANDWKEYVENQPECRETRIIYLNPLPTSFHDNWKDFKSIISVQNTEGQFCYTPDNKYTKLSDNCHKAYYDMIHGKR